MAAVDLARHRFADIPRQHHRRFVRLTTGSASLTSVLPSRFLGTLLVINAVVGVIAARPDGPRPGAGSALDTGSGQGTSFPRH